MRLRRKRTTDIFGFANAERITCNSMIQYKVLLACLCIPPNVYMHACMDTYNVCVIGKPFEVSSHVQNKQRVAD